MKILVTGSEGFIGKNLCLALSEQRHEIISFVRTTSLNEIENLVNKADAIIHLAGENRPKKPEDFEAVNFGLTSLLCEVMRKVKKHIPIIFASSIQAELSNPYGLSKRSAENILRRLYNDLHIPVGIYRLPNVFGKWCSPNYNSVVATFCHNIANNIPIKINDPNSALQLVHIDVVVKSFIQFIHNPIVNTKLLCNVKPVYKITLGELVKKIEQFKLISNTLQIAQVGNGLTKALYSTFVSYLPKSSFNYCLPKYSDDRGEFVLVEFKLDDLDPNEFALIIAGADDCLTPTGCKLVVSIGVFGGDVPKSRSSKSPPDNTLDDDFELFTFNELPSL